ncbi:MAG: acyl-CoA dehydrogenase family protein [Burkholderiales bacterium]
MNFDFDTGQKELRDQVRRFLQKESPTTQVRRVLDGELPYQQALWSGLAALGLTGAAIPEAYGGSGFGYLELCVVAEELGRSAAAVPFSSTVYLVAELLKACGSEAQKQAWLPRIATGQTLGALAWTEAAGPMDLSRLQTRIIDGRLHGRKAPVLDGPVADIAVVVARDDDHAGAPALALVDLHGPGVTRRTLRTLDATRGHAELSFDGASVERLGAVGEPARQQLAAALDRAAVLMAFEQVGGADVALGMARDYSLQRFAFGRPIGSFQALKHLMADMYTDATLARSNAYHGAWALSTGAAELPRAAAFARVSATRAYQRCAKDGLQVHGGMGFTWEFDCHLHYRRASLLSVALGSLGEWDARLIKALRTAA